MLHACLMGLDYAAQLGCFLMGGCVGTLIAMWCCLVGMQRTYPFTRLGRARRRWYRGRDERAALYMRAGMEPGDAVLMATQELRSEARDALS